MEVGEERWRQERRVEVGEAGGGRRGGWRQEKQVGV